MSDYKEIKIDALRDHPVNRDFVTAGDAWTGFVDSIREHGVITPLVVREEAGVPGYEIVSGHRRRAAAGEVGLALLPCVVRNLTTSEALDLLVVENLEREDLDAVEEARLVEALLADRGGDTAAVMARLSRSMEWIETRQGLLALGDEVCAAVRRPLSDENRLGLEAVRVLLAVPDDERERAVQMVLHPDFKMGVLNAREAAEVVKEVILEPRKKRMEWEANGKKFAKAWKKRLKESLTIAEAVDLVVMPVSWEMLEAGARLVKSGRKAEDFLAADKEKTWCQLAVRNGLPVWVVPSDAVECSCAVVDEGLLRLAEQARVEAGLEGWLSAPVLTGSQASAPVGSLAETGVEDPADVMAEIEAAENADPIEEDGESVMEQRMEHFGMIDLGAVKLVALWAINANSDPQSAPEYIPSWACELARVGEWGRIDQVCKWVMKLKAGASVE